MPEHAMSQYSERRGDCSTDTQYIIQQSGYTWALQQLGDTPELTILDAACGTGFGTSTLTAGASVAIGVDLALEIVAEAQARYRTSGLSYLVMDVEKLAFRNASFDVIISQDTIEHVQDDVGFVAEAVRVLNPTGTFIVFTPYREIHTTNPENPYHLREYSPETFRNTLQPHFATIRLFGRRSAPALRRVEATLDTVRKYDPLRLRSLIPRSLRHYLGSFWLSNRGAKTLDEVSVEDVEYVEGAPTGSTTLIAICQCEKPTT